MSSFNKVIMLGNLTRDPELTYLPNQTAICAFGLATNRKWKGQDGTQKEDVCFVDCKLFGKGGETFQQYVKKGNSVLIEGRLAYSTWEDRNGGGKRSKHEIVVDNFQFMPNGQSAADPQPAKPQQQFSPPSANDSDIPF